VQRLNQSRRGFLATLGAGATALATGCARPEPPPPTTAGPADFTLRIRPTLVDIAKDHTISTVGYDLPDPAAPIRLHEGVPVTVELVNDTDTPEFVHWHGMTIPASVDGAEEEKSLVVSPHGHLRYTFTPNPAGARWVHSHVMSMSDLQRGTYTGQFHFVYVEPKSNPGQYDREFFLTTHEWEPIYTTEEMSDEEPDADQRARAASLPKDDKSNGWEIGYQKFTINGKCLGFGEPLRVKQGERVLLHILNASATENIQLALAGHVFQVVGLDGNPVPNPQPVEVLELGTAERIDAVVEMKNPGIWILGTPHDDDRQNGMGIVVEYANRSGKPRWIKPPKKVWDYTIFGDNRPTPTPDEVIPMVFGKINGGTGGFNHWTVNGKQYEEQGEPRVLHQGKRYRLAFDNHTDDAHPVHLHRNSFELTNVHGKSTAGVSKDVVLLKGYRRIAADFTPTQEGLTLFHCHQQLHMDYGFKMLFNVV
jgi:FtsP/CotA-like multicopper oxidase with cupredoxin domain